MGLYAERDDLEPFKKLHAVHTTASSHYLGIIFSTGYGWKSGT